MTDKQRKRLEVLMGKTKNSCEKAMGKEFCAEHKGDCEKCLEDFMQVLFDNTTDSCKCIWCKRIGCGEYHSKCEHYKKYSEEMEARRIERYKNAKTKYIKVKGKGV